MLRVLLRVLIACLIIVTGVSAHGQTTLTPVSPDEPASHTFDERFSIKSSLQSLGTIQSALESFRKLTEATANTLPKGRLSQIGNTGWEIQNLGFVNHVGTVRGTLLKQDYQIKKLEYGLAQLKSKSGEVSQGDLLKAKAEYEKAHTQFLEFWNTFRIAD